MKREKEILGHKRNIKIFKKQRLMTKDFCDTKAYILMIQGI